MVTVRVGSEGKPNPGELEVTVSRGVVYVHSAPPALCPHVEWALSGVLGVPVSLDWTVQRAARGTYRAELSWQGEVGAAPDRLSAARLGAPAVRGHRGAQRRHRGGPVQRYACAGYLPRRDRHPRRRDDPRGPAAGDRRRAGSGTAYLAAEVERLLGKPWDDELETFRWAGEGAPVRWLHQVLSSAGAD